jgi:hypothetical protein
MHGGTNNGAPQGNRNAWRHGNRSAEAEAQLKILSQSNRDLKLIQKLENGYSLSQAEHDRLLRLYAESLGQD